MIRSRSITRRPTGSAFRRSASNDWPIARVSEACCGAPVGCLRSLQGQRAEVLLQSVDQDFDLAPLALLERLAREDAALRERERRQSAGPFDDRAQSLAALDRVFARKADFTLQPDRLLGRPLGDFLDDQEVEWCQHLVGRRIARQGAAQVDLDDVRLAGLPIPYLVTRQIRLASVSFLRESAAGANQVADGHARLQRILAGHAHAARDTHDLRRLVAHGLQLQFLKYRIEDCAPTGFQVEHVDPIARG